MKKVVPILVVVLVSFVAFLLWPRGEDVSEVPGAGVEGSTLIPSTTSADEGRITLEAIVVDIDGRAVPGAQVVAGERVALADEAGKAEFGLPTGKYTVTARADGYIEDGPLAPSEEVEVDETVSTLRLVLRKSAVLRGITTLDGAGIPASVEARNTDLGLIGAEVTSNEDGTFEIFVDPGGGRLQAIADGVRATSHEFHVDDGQQVEGFELKLSAAAGIAGTIRGEDGRGLAGTIRIEGDLLEPLRLESGADGTFRVDAMSAGEVKLIATADGYDEESVTITLEPRKTTDVAIELSESFGIYGTVRRPQKSPSGYSYVVLMNGGSLDAQVKTGGDEFRIDLEPASGAKVHAVNPFYADSEPIPATTGEKLELALRPGGTIAARTVTSDGEPVVSVEVAVERYQADGVVPYGPEMFPARGFYEDDGRFQLGPLRPGRYWVRVKPREDYAATTVGPISVRSGETTSEQRFVVTAGGEVVGQVKDEQGQPIAFANVQVFDPTGVRTANAGTADEQGNFRLTHVTPGRRSVRVAHPDYLTQVSSGVLVRQDEQTTRNIVLGKGKEGEKFSFHGIGAVLQAGDEGITIMEAMQDKPASLFGLQSGDKILAVDGEAIGDKSLAQVIELIRGEQGTAVKLQIEREGEGNLSVDVERGTVVVK